MKEYRKAILAGLALVIETLTASYADDVLDMNETTHVLTNVLVLILGVYSVWKVKNEQKGSAE